VATVPTIEDIEHILLESIRSQKLRAGDAISLQMLVFPLLEKRILTADEIQSGLVSLEKKGYVSCTPNGSLLLTPDGFSSL
jgi:hypothetical protein